MFLLRQSSRAAKAMPPAQTLIGACSFIALGLLAQPGLNRGT
ncbi:hypothetical protein Q2941_10255 [Bradyrhizobium sp. UFLA05-153]